MPDRNKTIREENKKAFLDLTNLGSNVKYATMLQKEIESNVYCIVV